MKIKRHERFEGVYYVIQGRRYLATKNLIPKFQVHNERVFKIGKEEYRGWDPYRSKLAGAILNGLKVLPIKKGSKVLYLGAGSGVTPSFISDIVGDEGVIYCVEFAQRPMRDLLLVCEQRKNLLPLFADARKPEKYEKYVKEVDVIYEDVAQPDQAKILFVNAKKFLKKDKYALLAIKSQCISTSIHPKDIYRNVLSELTKNFEILEKIDLSPFDKYHLFVLLKYKG